MKIPKDLRIDPPEWPDESELAREIADLNSAAASKGGTSSIQVVERLAQNVAETLIALAMNAWRIRVKLIDSNREQREEIGKDEVKKINRYCDAMFESLRAVGIEVKDRTGDAFDYGLPEKVVSAQPQPGLTREIIIETIRPTIYWNMQIARPGEVVIGTPSETSQKTEI